MLRFHVLIAPEYRFDVSKDSVLLKGLNFSTEDPWSDGVIMEARKKVQGSTLLIGHTKIPKKYVGKPVEYKHFVLKDNHSAMFEDIQLDYSHGKVNRVLTISQHFKKEYFDQYDDVIVMDNSKRKEYRKLATKAFLPSFNKIIKEKDFQTLDKKVEKFQKVIECHITGILFIRDNGRGYNNPYRHHFESSRAYEIVCNNILEQ